MVPGTSPRYEHTWSHNRSQKLMNDQNSNESSAPEPEATEEERIISIDQAREAQTGQAEAEEEGGRAQSEPTPSIQPGELDFEEIKTIIEAILFAAGEPLSSGKLADLAGAEDGHVARKAVEALQEEYRQNQKPYGVEEIAGGFRLMTLPQFDTWVGKLRKKEQTDSLSQAALETLSIVAYRQPIMRSEIEDIRGVQSGYILRSLIEKSLVRVAGRSEELGRPLLYGTTKKFLDVFGLDSLKDMPDLEDLGAGEKG